jgi:phage tail tube protein FII
MLATTPLQLAGKTYDRYSLNLAITGKYKVDGTTDASIAMRLTPTRIDGGTVETADAHAIGISLGTLAGSDAATQQAVAAIQSALQTYLNEKGL